MVIKNPVDQVEACLDCLGGNPYTRYMKELLRSTDPLTIAFAQALLSGEDIECFLLDVNMSVLGGGIGAFPCRLIVRPDDHDAAVIVMRDNKIPLGTP